MLQYIVHLSFLLCYIIITTSAITGSDEKLYFRRDYTYIQKENAFFKLHKAKLNFTEAISACNAEGARLFFPSSLLESENVFEFINRTNIPYIWIGVHDLYGEGSFVTLDGAIVDENYSNWGPGEPNNVNGAEHCVILRKDMTFNDQACNIKERFVCKRNTTNLTQNKVCETYDTEYKYEIDLDKCYKFHLTPRPWRDAFKVCKAEESQLAIINSETEARALMKEWAKYPDSKITGNFDRTVIHLGFNELLTPGEFLTVDGQRLSQAGYDKWGPTQPDNRAGLEHCGSMFKDGTLNDVDCNHKALFFCEKSLSQSGTTLVKNYNQPGAIVSLPDA